MIKNLKREVIINGYAYPFIQPELLEQAAPNLTFISMFTYGIGEDGHLIDLDDQAVIEAVRPYQVAPLMVITSFSETEGFRSDLMASLLQSEEMQDILLADIVSTIQRKGLMGVDFDFEYIYPEYREAYANLIGRARQILNPMGYVVTATVAPKTSADQEGLLYEGHDYRLIGEAANLVLVMTYEWGYTFGPPMAVAPLNKVKEVLDYAVTDIPPAKLLMGIPNYGYDWTLPFVQGESRARSVSNVEAEAMAKQYGAQIQFDPVAQSPHFNYTAEDGAEHEVWFENAQSIEAKLRLIEEYDLAGASYWNLMKPFPDNWRVLDEMYRVIKVV